MANAEVRLKVSKSSYEAKISKLQSLIQRLDSTMTDYQTRKTELDKFMDGSDDNYEKIKAQIDENIKSVRVAKNNAEASMKMLQETLKQMDEFGGKVGNLVQTATETAINGTKTAFDTMKLVD